MCRAGVWSHETYLNDMARGFNYVWTSPGRQFFNPIEMSYQAPFVDAAKSVDEQNRGNTFISYYNYGEMLGLALDLSLREQNLNLDDYMKLMWTNFGKINKYYSVEELHQTLNNYAGKEFGDAFFNNYIYKSGMPDFERLFKNVGIELKTENAITFGAFVRDHKLLSNPKLNSSAYNAGLQVGDKLIKVGDFTLNSVVNIDLALNKYNINDEVVLIYERYDIIYETTLKVQTDVSYKLSYLNLDDNLKLKKVKQNKALWLNIKE